MKKILIVSIIALSTATGAANIASASPFETDRDILVNRPVIKKLVETP
jgi:hypothetical protein